MRVLSLAALFILAVPALAQAEPQQETRSALGACLAAILDGAPVEDIKGQDVEIRRDINPSTCSVRVTGADPAVARAGVIEALAKRGEGFSPAKTRWGPGEFASRETYCSAPGRRAVNVLVSTAKPGEPLALIATVFESKERDTRCDRDEGLQTPVLEN